MGGGFGPRAYLPASHGVGDLWASIIR